MNSFASTVSIMVNWITLHTLIDAHLIVYHNFYRLKIIIGINASINGWKCDKSFWQKHYHQMISALIQLNNIQIIEWTNIKLIFVFFFLSRYEVYQFMNGFKWYLRCLVWNAFKFTVFCVSIFKFRNIFLKQYRSICTIKCLIIKKTISTLMNKIYKIHNCSSHIIIFD